MRPIMEMETAEETARKVIHLSPSRAPTPCDPHIHNCRWWPYSSSNEFGANTAVIIIILLCALICALVLNTAIRCFLRSSNSSRRRHPPDRLPQTQRDGQLQKPNCMAGAAPLVMATTLVYSAGMKLGGAEAEDADCAICLSEFEEGEGIRVLGSCKHGFHIHCIEQWLFSHSSCPICRRSCLASSPSSQQNVDCCSGNGENESSQQHVEPE